MDIFVSIVAGILIVIYFTCSIYGLRILTSRKLSLNDRLKWGAIIHFFPIFGFILFYLEKSKKSNPNWPKECLYWYFPLIEHDSGPVYGKLTIEKVLCFCVAQRKATGVINRKLLAATSMFTRLVLGVGSPSTWIIAPPRFSISMDDTCQ